MASGIYNRFKANVMKSVQLETDTINVALMAVGHGFTATHNNWSEVSANDIGNKVVYVAAGAAMAGKAVTQGATTKWAATNQAWGPGETLTAYHAVIYDVTVGPNDLILSIDFGGAQTCTNGTFTIQWDAAGILTLT